MKIALGSDHGGVVLKDTVLTVLKKHGCEIVDHGCFDTTVVDYPDFAAKVAQDVSTGVAERGILLCGTGVGMAITACKFKGVRAAALTDVFSAQMARRHNDLNVLCLGGRVIGAGLAEVLVETFLATAFEGGRHAARVAKIEGK